MHLMGLLDDLKTFVLALALGAGLTLSINFVVVNYTEGKAKPPAQAVQHQTVQQDVPYAPKSDGGASSYSSYY